MLYILYRYSLVILVVSCHLPLPAALAELEDESTMTRQRIADLESEVRQLRVKIALLNAELKADRANVTASVSQPVSALPPSAEDAANKSTAFEEDASTDDNSTANQPASLAPLSLYRTPNQILAGLPARLRPPLRGEWPREQQREAGDWLANEPVGHPIILTMPVKSVEVRPNKNRQPGDNQPEWYLVIRLAPSDFEFSSRKCTLTVIRSLASRHVTYSSDHEFTVPADTATATRSQNLKPGSTVQLLGRVQYISLDVKTPLVFPSSQRQPTDEQYAFRLSVAAWSIRCPELGLN